MAAGEPIHNNAKRQNTAATTRLLNIQLPPGEVGLAPEATDLQNCHTRGALTRTDARGIPIRGLQPEIGQPLATTATYGGYIWL